MVMAFQWRGVRVAVVVMVVAMLTAASLSRLSGDGDGSDDASCDEC